MNKHVLSVLAAAVVGLATAVFTLAQTTTTTVTKTVQNPDGSYTVIEYPAKKEVKVNLNPVTITGAKGIATILRDDDGTRIKLNLTDVPADVTTLTLYAVDDSGAVTALGPVTITNGTGTLATTTPLSKFMLVASPEAALTAYDPNTKILFRSAVPEGFAVVPLTSPAGEKVAAVSTSEKPATVTTVEKAVTAPTAAAPTVTTVEKVTTAPTAAAPTVTTVEKAVTAPTVEAATVATTVTTPETAYKVPMLNIPAYKKGDDTKIKVDFAGSLTGTRANVFIKPRKDGPTEVNLRFHELKESPAGKKLILWAVSPDNSFVKLGQIVNTPGRNEAEIKSEVSLPDFGLLVTMEDADGTTPLGPAVGTIHIVP